MTTYDEHVAELATIPAEMVLGFLAWYSFSGVKIDHSSLVRALLTCGLEKNLPNQPRSADVFRRVSTAAQKHRVPTSEPGILHNYTVTEVGKDSEHIWRRIVVQRVDTQEHDLGYTQLYEIAFNRGSNTIDVEELVPAGTYPAADQMVQEILSEFREWGNALNSYAVREHIRRILLGLNATVVRPGGGVFFIRREHAETVAALERLPELLGGVCSFHSMPLVDNTKQRAMLRQAFEDESVNAIDTLLGEIVEIRRSGKKISAEKFSSFYSDYRYLRDKAADYSDLLDDALATTASRLELAQEAIQQLMDSVRT